MNITVKDNFLIVETAEKKAEIKVIEDCEYIYKLNKKTIKARGGAAGLKSWIEKCYNDNFCIALANKVVNFIIEKGA